MHSQEPDKHMAGTGPQRADQYAALHSSFRWQVDTHFNIAQACCQRWAAESAGKGPSATPSRTAIRVHRPGAARPRRCRRTRTRPQGRRRALRPVPGVSGQLISS